MSKSTPWADPEAEVANEPLVNQRQCLVCDERHMLLQFLVQVQSAGVDIYHSGGCVP